MSAPSFAEKLNLADASLGSRVVFATDEWFARAENLLNPSPPTFDPNAYCPQGKVMDGWESRRRRLPGHDWCIVKLALPGRIEGVEMDTAFFTGNYVPRFSLEVAELPPEYCRDSSDADSWIVGGDKRFKKGGGEIGTCMSPEEIEKASSDTAAVAKWTTVIEMTPLKSGVPETRRQFFPVPMSDKTRRVTHVRVNYFPDGGVARLRVHGTVIRDFATELMGKGELELSSVLLGGRGLGCSNQHFGVPTNLLRSGRGVDMGDGWETARHLSRPPIIKRDPKTGLVDTDLGDWSILRMACVVENVTKLVLETTHFKGNYPESVKVEYCCRPKGDLVLSPPGQDAGVGWKTLLKRTRMGPDAVFEYGLADLGSGMGERISDITHLRLHIYPDGGVSRVRLFGQAKSVIDDEQNEMVSML